MIIFEYIKYKNFLATGNQYTTIELNKNPSTLVIGTNGTGKSTMLDAIHFSLFGSPFRAINKPQLVNSTNEKECVTEIAFTTHGKRYKVIRGIKPGIFEIYENDKLCNQNSAVLDQQDHFEKNILRLNQKSFSQIVVLGTDFIPFMKLTALDRRTIIEDLLGIRIFTSMNVVLKEKIATNKVETDENITSTTLITEKKKLIERHISEILTNTNDRLTGIQNDIDTHQTEIIKFSDSIKSLDTQIKKLKKTTVNKKDLETKLSSTTAIETNLGKSYLKINKDIDFFENSEKCPTCQQTIDEGFKTLTVQEKTDKIRELENAKVEIAGVIKSLKEEIRKIETVEDQIETLNYSKSSFETQITSAKKYITKLEAEKLSIKNAPSVNEVNTKELDKMNVDLKELLDRKKSLMEELQSYNVCAILLKDSGIKTQIIKQYLPVINNLVNKYLSDMDFYINFSLDETFKETIKSRHRDIFSYSSFSNGQKKRIDLALLFTWREIAKMKNSMNTNLLIFDEVTDGAMDNAGLEEFLKLIKTRGEKTNTFVITPKGDHLADKFSNVIKFQINNGFSKIV